MARDKGLTLAQVLQASCTPDDLRAIRKTIRDTKDPGQTGEMLRDTDDPGQTGEMMGTAAGRAKAEDPADRTPAEQTADLLLTPGAVARWLRTMTEEQYALLAQAQAAPMEITEDQAEDAEALVGSFYAIWYYGRLAVTDDVWEAVTGVDCEALRRCRKQNSWLVRCLNFLSYLYVAAPEEVLLRMFRDKPGYKLEEAEFHGRLRDLLTAMPQRYAFRDGLVIDQRYIPGKAYRMVLDRQEEENFAVPGWREVEDLAEHGYISEERYIQELRSFLQNTVPMSFDEAERLTREAWNQLSKDVEFGQTVKWLMSSGAVLSEQKQVDRLLTLLQMANNRTRKLYRRGHTPGEVHSRTEMAQKFQSELIRAEELRRVREEKMAKEGSPAGRECRK